MTLRFSPAVGLALLAGVFAPLGISSEAAAGADLSSATMLKMIQEQQQQLDRLKAQLKASQARTASEIAEVKSAGAVRLPANLEMSGAIEIEATDASTFAGVDSSDLTLAKVELALDAAPGDWVATHVQFVYEDDGNENITLDEAFATLGNAEKSPVYLTAGKWALPFGGFDTDMNTDPLIKDIGETKEAALLIGAAFDNFVLEGYAYNGDSQVNASNDRIDQYGLSLGYGGEVGGSELSVGIGYIRNIADSDGLTDGLGGSATTLNKYVGGAEIHGAWSRNGLTLRAGYLRAQKSFQTAELAFNGQGAKPGAWNVEAAWTTEIAKREVTIAATAQGTNEALALGLAEKRLGGAVTVGVYDDAAITFEYLHDSDYSTAEGGTGKNGHTGTVKLAVDF